MPKKQTPINRVNKFFSEEDFSLDINMGRVAIENDGNFVVILYRVDRANTNTNVYGESGKDEVRFFPPVELRVIPIMNAPELGVYNKDAGSVSYLQDGPLEFDIYTSQLDELDVEIRRGDFIGYPVTENIIRYCRIVNDGIKNYDNEHTIVGYKGAFRTVNCAAISEDEFRGL